MKKKNFMLILAMLSITLLGGLMTGCTEEEVGEQPFEQMTITISGSSAMLPLMEKSIEGFMEKYPDVDISAQAGGSGTGLQQISQGSVNIANSDLAAEDKLSKTKAAELVDHKVIAQGFGVVVSKDLGVTNLTTEQIKGIFSGKITNWSEVGGPDRNILVVHRPSSSGTRYTFTNTILGGDKTLENNAIGATQDNNGSVLTTMKQNDGSISYVSLSYMKTDDAQKHLRTVTIDGVEATKENIITDTYKFWSFGHMYTKGPAKDLEKAFIEYVQSPDNYDSLDSLGLISGKEIKNQ